MEKQKYKEIMSLTGPAKNKFTELVNNSDKPNMGIRIELAEYQTNLSFSSPEDRKESDVIQDLGEFVLVMDSKSAELLEGATLEFNNGFSIEPADGKNLFPTSKEWGEPVADAVQHVVDQSLNPGLSGHNGWVKLLEVKGDTAFIEMGGGCKGCMHSYMTLKSTIETQITEKVESIKKVVDTTDHADGQNPYYAPEE
ncbi:MAG: NifU family protein [Anaerolineaceae bacterium]|nr:NifU family protein [Anaerolineaceae bacterium]